MERLIRLLLDKESWLMERMLHYASRHGFTAHAHALARDWRALTEAMSEGLSSPTGQEIETAVHSDWAQDPVTRFGLAEARLCRERGVEPSVFLELLIYCRRTYQDCVREFHPAGEDRDQMERIIMHLFDRIGLAFCSAWTRPGDEEVRTALASALWDVTNEKKRYLTFFESLAHPVLIVTADGILENMNRAASLLLDSQAIQSQAPCGRPRENEATRRSGLKTEVIFPWLTPFLRKILATAESTLSDTICMPCRPKDRTFRATMFRQPDASGKFGEFSIMLRDETERIEIRRQIVRAKEELERTFDTIPDLVFMIDPSGVILRANKSLADKLGLSPRTVVGKACRDLLGCTECRFEGSFCRTQDLPIAYPNIPGNYLIRANELRNADGEIVGRVIVARDVSATERIRATLMSVENKYKNIFDHAPVGIFQSTPAGTYLSVNTTMARMFGFKSPEDMLRSYTDIARQMYVRPEDRAAIFAEAMANDTIVAREVELLRQDGTPFWCRLHGRIARDDNGNMLHFEGFTEDVTVHHAVLQQLEENEKRFRSLAETMAQGLTQINSMGVMEYCNDHLCELFGASRETLLGTHLSDYVHEEDVAQCRAMFDQNICHLRDCRYDIRFKSAGKTLFTLVTPLALYDKDKSCRAYWLLILDITERKMIESQLLQTQKLEAIGQLAAGVAHEINTPTQYVMNNMWFIKEGVEQLGQAFAAYRDFVDNHGRRPEMSREALALKTREEELQVSFYVEELPAAISETLQGLDRISSIVNSVKQFAHPGHVRQQAVNLNELVANTVTLSRNEWKYVAEMSTDLDPELPPVLCEAQAIGQVLLNLVVNAAHAIVDVQRTSGRNGHITISTRKVPQGAEIRVHDTGAGIPVHAREHIFEPFFTTKPVGKGTGQGLFIAHRTIVAEHGGAIRFETEIGQGTTFIITLPVEGKDHDEHLV